MFGDTNEQKDNLRDTNNDLAKYHKKEVKFLSYTRVNKLITALYMVTDIMDQNEPLRHKLRTLGVDIISDTYSLSHRTENVHKKMDDKISEILSFLEIAKGIKMVSEMNSEILKREFLELKNSVLESNTDITKTSPSWLEEFMKEESDPYPTSPLLRGRSKEGVVFNGQGSTRIGVQKGGTLLKALSRVESIKALSDKIPNMAKKENVHYENHERHISYELKNKRREAITQVIKDKMNTSINFEGLTITDIKSIGHETLKSCGEKTLQRELVSMVLDGVLKKVGEKRWSRYSLI